MRATIGLLLFLLPTTLSSSPCFCDDVSLCRPLSGPPLSPVEVFGFSSLHAHTTTYWNWTHLTSVAWATDSITCELHAHGVRSILGSPKLNLTHLSANPVAAEQWIVQTVRTVVDTYRDGITFDYEQPMTSDSIEAKTYVYIIQQTNQRLKAISSSYQVTVCVAWSAYNIDGRDYPVTQLAAVSDALYVMDYDTQSQITDSCIASANAPYYGMVQGLQSYLSLVSPSQLILGVPWYGYRYECVNTTHPTDRYCPLSDLHPFRDVPCSDAAGTQHTILEILQACQNATIQGRDAYTLGRYCNTVQDDRVVVQYWWDDAASLRKKVQYARQYDLRGAGPYALQHTNALADFDNATERAELWNVWSVLFDDDTVEIE